MELKIIWSQFNRELENYLQKNLPRIDEEPEILHQAMWYSLEDGKRVRPFLAFLGYKLNKEEIDESLYDLASALELIHNFSLVHDDLPALDNDDYRRNKLTVHRKFSEAIAILTGDALFAYAFRFLNRIDREVADIVLNALLSKGMIGGQVIDIQKNVKNIDELFKLYYYKTGKLIEASLVSGYLLSKGEKLDIVKKIGSNVGFIFQIVDDILDKDKDEDINILKFLKYDEVIKKIEELRFETIELINNNFKNISLLCEFVDFLAQRDE